MAVTSEKIHLSGLARKLVIDGLIKEENAVQAFQDASRKKVPFVAHVVSQGLANARDIAHVASMEFGVPLLDLDAVEVDLDITKLVQEKLVRQHHTLPLYKRGNRLYVAASDPTNLQALDEIKFHTGSNVEAILVEDDKLVKAIDKALEAADTSMADLTGDDDLEDLDDLEVADDQPDSQENVLEI